MAKKKKSLNEKQQRKFAKVMREFAAGTLRRSDGKKVTSLAEARAIAFSEARRIKG